MQVRVLDNLHEAIRFIADIEAAFGIDEMLDKMAEILEFEHTQMFDRGYRTEDQPWVETDPFWQKHMKDYGSHSTLKWTGNAQKSIRADVRGNGVEVSGAAYLGKFDPAIREATGQSPTFTELLFVEVTGDGPNDWVKLSDADFGSADKAFPKKITVKDRHVFDVTMDDVSQMMHELAAAANMELAL